MKTRVNKSGLQVDALLAQFIDTEAIVGTGVDPTTFWKGFSGLVNSLGPKNSALLQTRHDLQKKIDEWHLKTRSQPFSFNAYKEYLLDIGYIVPKGDPFKIDTENVDLEISSISGPQLVVPVTNARYSLNAANARWGSFYDALYGTDALGDLPEEGSFDIKRGERVIKFAKAHLDATVPLENASWTNITSITVLNNNLILMSEERQVSLSSKNQFIGYIKDPHKKLSEVIFSKNELHLRLLIDPNHSIGKIDLANISDIILESAVSTIMDCEDSVSTVDAEDKVLAYRNWLGLMKGDLEEQFIKSGRKITRKLNPDLEITNPSGSTISLKARSLMLNRNVGHLMNTPAILDCNGNEIPEGLMDAICTTLIGMHDLLKTDGIRNSLCKSIYIVKPKLHGPDEVSFTDETFSLVEQILGIPKNTVKIGIMDEERRTSVNLMECIRAAHSRVAFINTGFLDRTGDEIHTSMEAGPMLKKGDMKNSSWIKSYEDRNVDIGLACGLMGRAQIGKGMWAMPDLMGAMLDQKKSHPEAGANCAWVPSPTAATLHATHYHKTSVSNVQMDLIKKGSRASLTDLLTIPIADSKNWSEEEIQREIENNCQGILGYVVRWIDQGIGCSKVLDINNVGLMEDRATCRISAQALTNWLHHNIINNKQVQLTMEKMAAVVDKQNSLDPLYIDMAPSYKTVAFKAACDLVFSGKVQPSGYTEPVLHAKRINFKSSPKP